MSMAERTGVFIDYARITKSILSKAATAQKKVYVRALADCNRYCRVKSGRMRATSMVAGKPSVGRLTWRTPYAARVYYTGKPSVSVNPNASLKWAHRAAAANRGAWLAAVRTAMKGKLT